MDGIENIVIIGSGAAGLTAAIYAARADLKPLVIAGGLPGGQLTQTTDVENFPGFQEGIQGFSLMYNMQQQAERFGTKIKNDIVKEIKKSEKNTHIIILKSGESIIAKSIIIATGATPRWLGLKSETKLKNKGVSACATCDGAFYRDVPVMVIGGGDTAMEEACFLTKFASKVFVVHRRDKLRASKIMSERAKNNPKIEFLWDSVVEELHGEEDLNAVTIKNVNSNEKYKIECKGYFVALGHIPNTKNFIDSSIDADEQGYIKTTGTETNIKGIFAAGDCVDHKYQQAIVAAGMGAKASIDAEQYLENL